MDIWNMYEIVSNSKKKIFLLYLEELIQIEKYEETLSAIKLSGIYLALDTKLQSEKQARKIDKILIEQLYPQNKELVNKFFEELHFLANLKQKVKKDFVTPSVESLPKNQQVYYLLQSINFYLYNNFSNSITDLENSEKADLSDTIISSSSNVLKFFIYNNFSFTKRNRKSFSFNFKKFDALMEAASLDSFVNDIINIWMHSKISLESVDGKNILTETGTLGVDLLLSKIPFLELKDILTHKNSLTNNILGISKKFNIKQYIYSEKESVITRIYEYFYTNDLLQIYKDSSLMSWIDVYFTFYEISLTRLIKRKKAPSLIIYSEKKWKKILSNSGIPIKDVNNIFNYLVFSRNSNDLYDSPLIKLDNFYALIPSVSLSSDISRSLLSQFGTQEDKHHSKSTIRKKGTNFEKHIKNLTENITSNLIPNKSVKVPEDYELDLIFNVGNDVFFVEAKTQKQPETYRDYLRNQIELDKYLKSFSRNSDFFSTGEEWDKILNKLNLNNKVTLTKIFVTNVVQSKKSFKDILITNEIDYYKYMKKQSETRIFNSSSTGDIYTFLLDSCYYEGEVSANHLKRALLSNSVTERNRKKIDYRINDLTDQLNTEFRTYFIKESFITKIDPSIKDEVIVNSLIREFKPDKIIHAKKR